MKQRDAVAGAARFLLFPGDINLGLVEYISKFYALEDKRVEQIDLKALKVGKGRPISRNTE